jgi:hypothetical protein
MTVYVAGPYTIPDPCENTHRAVKAADELLARGYTPYIPHLNLTWQLISPKPYAFWLEYDLIWLARCDAVLRLPGASHGADKEVEYADAIGIPVFSSIIDLVNWSVTDV